jgi:hypothetical protein
MSYTHTQIEAQVVNVGVAADPTNLISAADLGALAAGYQPFKIKAIAAVVAEALGTADATVELDKRVTAGSDTGRTQQAVMTIPQATAAVGDVYYQDGLDITINPGEEAVVETDGGASTTGGVNVILFIEPLWETPDNNTAMTELTA